MLPVLSSMLAKLSTIFLVALVAASLPAFVAAGAKSQPTPTRRGASFVGIGDLPGGDFHSEALAVSDDGRVVIGRSSSADFVEEGLRFANGTLSPLLGPGGVPMGSEPRGLTPDGAIVAGKILVSGNLEAARWTEATGWIGLGDLTGGLSLSQALGISADGTVIVGWGTSHVGFEAARWVGGQAIVMGDLDGGAYNSAAGLASTDGTTIVGTGHSAQGPEVFVWTQATGMVGLGDLAGGEFSSEPFGMTPDASVIVGEATSSLGIEAFRWTSAGGMVGLGDLPGGEHQSIAFDVSADGSIVVGYATTALGTEAFIWDATNGMRNLKQLLLSGGVTAVEDWVLTDATGISADGTIVVGNGTNPSGQTEGWVAELAPITAVQQKAWTEIRKIYR